MQRLLSHVGHIESRGTENVSLAHLNSFPYMSTRGSGYETMFSDQRGRLVRSVNYPLFGAALMKREKTRNPENELEALHASKKMSRNLSKGPVSVCWFFHSMNSFPELTLFQSTEIADSIVGNDRRV